MSTVVITGASSGIGESCALAFARLKRPLVLGARRADRLERVAAACKAAGAPKVLTLPLDVRSQGSIDRFAAAAAPETPEVLINNAGLALGRDHLAAITDAHLDGMVETNVSGLVRVSRAFLPGMIARRAGHVVNLGSIAAIQAYEGGAVYCATKAAVRAISRTLRLELLGTNIRVTEVAPGMVETEFSIVRLGDEDKAKSVYKGWEPLRPDDVADAVAWAVTRPGHVHIHEILLTAIDQASVSKVNRKS
jgi:3-hydroxy acid dehydrogenase / malonic semialdehyde reductase